MADNSDIHSKSDTPPSYEQDNTVLPSLPRFMQPDEDLLRRRRQTIGVARNRLMVLVNHLIVLLHDPYNDVPGLGQRELLAQTDARPAVEGQELPAGLPADPAVGLELVGVGAPEVLAAVHGVHDVVDLLALLDIDGGQAVGPAAAREGGVSGGAAAVDGHVGVEAEDFGQDVLQVGAGFEVGEGDATRMLVGTELIEDDAAELVVDVWVADEEVEGPS